MLIQRPALATSKEFLDYAPQSRVPKKNYIKFLDELGFKTEDEAAADELLRTRDEFIRDFKHHVDSSHYKFLIKQDNEKAFDTMVGEFLSKYGAIYWGSSKRDHLTEMNPIKGFLYPRDAERGGSR